MLYVTNLNNIYFLNLIKKTITHTFKYQFHRGLVQRGDQFIFKECSLTYCKTSNHIKSRAPLLKETDH